MRGGTRPGSGRKSKEPTTVIRIPDAILDQVRTLIEAHKQGIELITATKERKIKQNFEFISEIKKQNDGHASLTEKEINREIQRRVNLINARPAKERKDIINIWGSIYKAAREGYTPHPQAGFIFIDKI